MPKHQKRKRRARRVESVADRAQRRHADLLRRQVRRQKQLRALSLQLERATHAADIALVELEDRLRQRRQLLPGLSSASVALEEGM